MSLVIGLVGFIIGLLVGVGLVIGCAALGSLGE
jgi:hypothetical protein